MTILTVVLGLMAHGCGLGGAVGITANFAAESNLNPSAVGPSGIGLAQLAGIRRQRMLATLGPRWKDEPTQLAYLVGEMRELRVWDKACRLAAAEAAQVIMLEYELPRARDPRYRRARAVAIYEEVRWLSRR